MSLSLTQVVLTLLDAFLQLDALGLVLLMRGGQVHLELLEAAL